MTNDQLDLARRLVSHQKWRWVAGMQPYPETLYGCVAEPGLDEERRLWDEQGWRPPAFYVDLTDYATAAILFRMAAEADTTPRADKTPRRVIPDGTVPDWRPKIWACHVSPPGQYGWVEEEDLGTLAAQALLEAWGEP